MEYHLKAADEAALMTALEAAGVAEIQWLGRGEVVSNAKLISALDQQILDADLSCVYQGQDYSARDGEWLVLLPVAVPRGGYSLVVLGEIRKPTGKMITVNGPCESKAQVHEYAPIPGWHADLLGDLTDEQRAILPIIEAPKNRVHAWAS